MSTSRKARELVPPDRMPADSPSQFVHPTEAPGPARSPVASAAILAVGYAVVAWLYILISSDLAGAIARDVDDLRRIEQYKGAAFVLVTGAALFGLNLAQLRRLRAHQDDRNRRDRALHNAERAILAGTFARTVGHDINNGLQIAMGALDELRLRAAADAEQARLVGELEASLSSIRDWNRRLFELGGARLFGEVRSMDLAQTVAEVARLAQRHEHVREARLEVDAPERLPFRGRDVLIQRALLNLVLNAAEAAGPGGRIRVTVSAEGDGRARIVVDDSGPGVPRELRAKVVEPFFTSKPSGSGLGLAAVQTCAAEHQGALRIEESPLAGARFVLELRPIVGE